MMKKHLLGFALIALIIVSIGALVFFLALTIHNIANGIMWEENFMRVICVCTVIALATPSVYKWYKQA